MLGMLLSETACIRMRLCSLKFYVYKYDFLGKQNNLKQKPWLLTRPRPHTASTGVGSAYQSMKNKNAIAICIAGIAEKRAVRRGLANAMEGLLKPGAKLVAMEHA